MRRQRKQRIKKTENNLRFWLVAIITLFSFLIFNETGFITWINLKNEKEKKLTEVQSLLNQQIKLKKEIEQLKSDEQYLQQIAREKFMMVKPGEKVFRVIDNKKTKDE